MGGEYSNNNRAALLFRFNMNTRGVSYNSWTGASFSSGKIIISEDRTFGYLIFSSNSSPYVGKVLYCTSSGTSGSVYTSSSSFGSDYDKYDGVLIDNKLIIANGAYGSNISVFNFTVNANSI